MRPRTRTGARIFGVWTIRSKVALGDVMTPTSRASRPGNGWGEGAKSVMGRMGEAKAELDGAGTVRQRRMPRHDARIYIADPAHIGRVLQLYCREQIRVRWSPKFPQPDRLPRMPKIFTSALLGLLAVACLARPAAAQQVFES